MRSILLLPAGAALLAASGFADVTLEARGVVAANSIASGPLANANPGDPVTMTWDVIVPGNETDPGHQADYTVDAPSFSIDAGGNVVHATQSFSMLMVNDLPVSDGVYIFFTSFGPHSLEFEVGNGDGTFFGGVDITQEAGTLTNTMISSFNWAVHGGGSMFIDFEQLEIRPGGGSGTAYCFGDGTGSVCPCANLGAAGEGCENSTGIGATLTGTGSVSVASDALAFDAHHLIPNQPALLFSGETAIQSGNGLPFGDGLRCAGTNVKRLGVALPDANGDASWGPGLGAIGGWAGGDTRYFQAWYRDPSNGPCGTGFNLSHGVEIQFEL